MIVLAFLFFGWIALPWLLDAADAWDAWRTVRRECRDLDLELDLL